MLSTRSRILASAAALALAASPLLTDPAAATHTTPVDTQVVINPNPPAFHGKLRSAKPDCVQQRRVKIFRQRAGADQLVGHGFSTHSGKWKIDLSSTVHSGNYYAKTPKFQARNDVCRAAVSGVVAVQGTA
jgi:hypothetical protein